MKPDIGLALKAFSATSVRNMGLLTTAFRLLGHAPKNPVRLSRVSVLPTFVMVYHLMEFFEEQEVIAWMRKENYPEETLVLVPELYREFSELITKYEKEFYGKDDQTGV